MTPFVSERRKRSSATTEGHAERIIVRSAARPPGLDPEPHALRFQCARIHKHHISRLGKGWNQYYARTLPIFSFKQVRLEGRLVPYRVYTRCPRKDEGVIVEKRVTP